jgi:hypothetical protein
MTYQQRKPSPPPETIDLVQPGLPHPAELRFDRGDSILRVVLRTADEIQELAMELGGRRRNDIEIGDYSMDRKLLGNLTEEVALSLVLEMMDGESGDHDVERSERRQRIIQVPLSDLDPVVTLEPISGMPEHGWRRVHGDDALDALTMFEDESSQSAVAAAQVEYGAG